MEARGELELTRRLFERASVGRTGPDSEADSALAACEFACEELSLSLGPPGFNVLLKRALVQSEAAHPILRDISVGNHAQPVFNEVAQLIEKHGSITVAVGLAAVLDCIFTLLGRLIGDDLVAQLVERDAVVTERAAEESR